MSLPIDTALPRILNALAQRSSIILSAEPGAGKTTRVPIALLELQGLGDKKIVMLEPRRLAASRSAQYMAAQLGERVGDTVGYRIRGESKIGKSTRIEVVTEGILTRMLHGDPSLAEYGVVIFDEFHERSIHADLGLALTQDVQKHLRPDLKIVVMSATLDAAALKTFLTDAEHITSEGRVFPVETRYLAQQPEGRIEPVVVSAVLRALRSHEGDILVFLPGQGEIRRVSEQLYELLHTADGSANTEVHLLYGEANPTEQRAALEPAPAGKRKVILATSIAETSLTIDGVRVVIDAGLSRTARFDPRRGMSGLVTVGVSQAGADQRRGRAGRQAPGVCYRLWTEARHTLLPQFTAPEILVTDLAPFALDLARWGSPGAEGLNFLDAPPPPHLAQARALLHELGAVDAAGKLTSHGTAMADLPVHPRYAHMLLKGKELGRGSHACDIAALLEERDLFRGDMEREIDLHSRWLTLRSKNERAAGSRERITAQADRLRKLIGVQPDSKERPLGILLALAYPERVAQRREPGSPRYQLSGGTGATLPKSSRLMSEEYLAVGDVDGTGNDVRIYLAEPLQEQELRETFSDLIETIEEVRWDERDEAVVARKVTRLGTIELASKGITSSGTSEKILAAMIEGIRLLGLAALPWTKQGESVRARSEWLRTEGLAPESWPDLSDNALLASLDTWLAPYLDGMMRRAHLARLEMTVIINGIFSYEQMRELDRLTPTHLTVPTGSHIPIEYAVGQKPVLAVRLQEMFGQTNTPTVANGKVPVLLHLLSPGKRPLAVTQDLPSFWKNAYPGVRKDTRGRYPKHYWPENPLEAEPTRRAKPRGT